MIHIQVNYQQMESSSVKKEIKIWVALVCEQPKKSKYINPELTELNKVPYDRYKYLRLKNNCPHCPLQVEAVMEMLSLYLNMTP